MSNDRTYWSLATLLEDLEKGIKNLRKELKPYCDEPRVASYLESKEKDWHDFKRYVSKFYLGCPMGTLVNSLRAQGVDSRFYGGMTHRGRDYFKVPNEIERIIMDIETAEFYAEERKSLNEQFNEKNNTDYCIPDETTQQEYDEMYEREGRS